METAKTVNYDKLRAGFSTVETMRDYARTHARISRLHTRTAERDRNFFNLDRSHSSQ
jgi:hypothetical protein